MTGLEAVAVAACGLPLLAAVANGLNAVAGERLYGQGAVSKVAVAAVFGSFAASIWVAAAMLARGRPIEVVVYDWLDSGDLSVAFAFRLDELTVVMMLVVTAISWLVTYFSVNYMHNEPGFSRYFTVVPLFVFAMLVLVMADNYLLMFLGWEGVGVCSYLLVGFYRDRSSAAQAGTRAFVMNRVGDAGLLLAMFLLVVHTGSLRFVDVFPSVDSVPSGVLTGICLLLLWGAIGKSAQLPLGTWLAKAMEGPTPSSALIHAATMVTAGVYLVVRSSPLFDAAPTALLAVGLVGALTALYGQLVGYVQTDIKGMLAASTTAQLGVMFIFCGLGLYPVAIFHLVVHAFYKTYLFLTAPSILHHLHGGADPATVRRPTDTATALSHVVLAAAVGLLALPLLAPSMLDVRGALDGNLGALVALGVVAIFAVVYATVRMIRVSFAGHQHADAHGRTSADRTPAGRLAAAMFVIAVLVALGSAAGVLPGGIAGTWFYQLLDESVGVGPALSAGDALMAGLFVAALALLAVSGVLGPRFFDRFRDELPAGAVPRLARRLYWRALHRGLLDEHYARAVTGPTVALGRTLRRFDRRVIEGAVGTGSKRSPTATGDWEARFAILRRAHAEGSIPLTEAPARLDWLPPARVPVAPSTAQPGTVGRAGRDPMAVSGTAHGRGVVERAENAVARSTETIERVVFRGSPERGTAFLTAAMARAVEAVERVVFQANVERVAALITAVIAGFTEAVERAVFQLGVERAVHQVATMGQRSLLTIESRLGHPLVMGALLAAVLVIVVVGT